ncbi:XkdX family protein [Clostridium botulinum]|nr:XkdX family protein [Clostridium botulinum]
MEFWKMCFNMKVIDSDFLRQAVVTDSNKYGDITTEQFKEITKEDFFKVISQ